MDRVWCIQCGSEIRSIITNRGLPLDSFHLDFKQELNSNEIYCSYCARNIDLAEKWNIEYNIRIAHDSFSNRLYFSPEIINYSPVEFELRETDKVPKIKLELVDSDQQTVYEHTMDGRSEEISYLPPFSKNAIDFSWTYSEIGQDEVYEPDVSKKYSGGCLTAISTFMCELYPMKLEFDPVFKKKFSDIQTMVVENNI